MNEDTKEQLDKLRQTLLNIQNELDELIDSINKYEKMWNAIKELQDLTDSANLVHSLLYRER